MARPWSGAFLWAAAAVLATMARPGPAWADGCVIAARPEPQADPVKIHEPNQKAIISYANGREDLYLQVRYSGATEKFAWLVPTPSRPEVSRAGDTVFEGLMKLIDFRQHPERYREPGRGAGGFGGGLGGGMGGLTIVERSQVGIYSTTVLAARSVDALVEWLDANGFHTSPETKRVCRSYIDAGWYFTAMRIDLQKAGGADPARVAKLLANGTIQPIRLSFAADAPVYPLRISSLNGGRSQVLLYLLTPVPVQRPFGFSVTFAEQAPPDQLQKYAPGLANWGQPVWLTEMSRTMLTASMDRDLVFAAAR